MSYCAIPGDLTLYAIPATAFGTLQIVQLQAMADAQQARVIDARLRSRYTLPLKPPYDLLFVEINAILVGREAMHVRGYDPKDAQDVQLEKRWADAIADLDLVQRRLLHPLVFDSGPNPDLEQPTVASRGSVANESGRRAPLRGW